MLSKALATFAMLLAIASAEAPKDCHFIDSNEARRINFGFNMASLFPGVLPGFTPKLFTNVTYGSGKRVDIGNTFNIPETLMEPTYAIGAEPNFDPATTKYFLLMIDPDAPSPNPPLPLLETIIDDFLHHAIQDIQPSCITKQSPQVIRAYLSPTPLSIEQHRYIFLTLRQPANFMAPPETRATIFGLKLGDFIKENNLTIVGGNYFKEGATDLGLPLPSP